MDSGCSWIFHINVTVLEVSEGKAGRNQKLRAPTLCVALGGAGHHAAVLRKEDPSLFLLRAPFGQYGPVAATWPLSVYRSRLAPWTRGESNHGKLSVLRPIGHGRYRFATASAKKRGPVYSSANIASQIAVKLHLPDSPKGHTVVVVVVVVIVLLLLLCSCFR